MAFQYCDIPHVSPFKFYKNTATPGVHFDDDWFKNRIAPFDTITDYMQRWKVGDDTTLQIISTIAPGKLEIYNCKKTKVGELDFSPVLTSASFPATVHQVNVNLDTAYASGANPVLYLYFKCQTLDTAFEWISEPINVKTSWPNTSIIQAWNNTNDYGAYFYGTGYRPKFRIEAMIRDYEPAFDNTSFADQLRNTKKLSAMPYRKFKLQVGTAPGVSEPAMDILNRMICLDNWKISDKQFAVADGAKWDINRQKNWPLIGGSIDVVEYLNLFTNQQNAGSVEPGIVTSMLINSQFNGTAQQVFVEEVTITN